MKKLWWRILLAGVVLEILYAFFIFGVLGSAEQAYTATGFSGAFLFMMIGGLWIGRHAESHAVVQGALVAVVAILFYTALGMAAVLSSSEPTIGISELFAANPLINHLLKLVGAAVGACIGRTWLAKGERAAA